MTTSEARRWMAVARIRRARRSASSRAFTSRSRTRIMASRRPSCSTWCEKLVLGRLGIDAGNPFEFGPGVLLETVKLLLTGLGLAFALDEHLLALGEIGRALLEGCLTMAEPGFDRIEFDPRCSRAASSR